jgi:hypothetical protein
LLLLLEQVQLLLAQAQLLLVRQLLQAASVPQGQLNLAAAQAIVPRAVPAVHAPLAAPPAAASQQPYTSCRCHN